MENVINIIHHNSDLVRCCASYIQYLNVQNTFFKMIDLEYYVDEEMYELGIADESR